MTDLIRLAALAAACAALAACGGGKKDETAAVTDDDGAPAAAAAPSAPVGVQPAEAAAAAANAPPASEAEGVSLSNSDQKLATGQFYDAYPLTAQAGKGTIISVTSRGFRPVIVILDSNQEKLSETEALGSPASDGSYTVEMSDDLPAGNYYVIVAAADVGATGAYTIEAKTSTPLM